VLAIASDDEDASKRHVQVLTGNRLPRGSASRSFRIVGADVVKGGEPMAVAKFIESDGKDVEEMLAAPPIDSKKRRAKMLMLGMLEAADDLDECIESDKLTTDVMAAVSASFETVRNGKTELKKAGLICFVPEKSDSGKVKKWLIKRSGAERPDNLVDPPEAPAATTAPAAPTGPTATRTPAPAAGKQESLL
jgi:hypothetical protein